MLETGGDVRLTYNFVHSNSEVRAPTTSCANSKILRVPSTKMLCRNFTILRLLRKPRPSCLSLGGGHEGGNGMGNSGDPMQLTVNMINYAESNSHKMSRGRN